jgi:hypothetical protein
MTARVDIDPAATALDAMLESGSPDEVLELLAPDAVLWHNDDKGEVPAAVGVGGVGGLHALLSDIRVEVVQHEALKSGFLHRFAIHGVVRSSGAPLLVHNCVVVSKDGDKIGRIDEYVDPTFRAQLGV